MQRRSGIYKITNQRTGKSYIGQSNDVQRRLNEHKRALNKGNHRNTDLQRDHNRGDRFSYRVLEETPYLDEREKYFIKHYNTFHDGYNMTRGGSGRSYSPTYQRSTSYKPKSYNTTYYKHASHKPAYYNTTYYNTPSYQSTDSKKVKKAQNIIITGMVGMGLYLLTLYVSSLIFRPLGDYSNMIVSTIVALFVSSYVILRWKTSFKLDISKFFENQHNPSEATKNNNTTPNNKVISDYTNASNRNTNSIYGNKSYIFVETVRECKSKIQNMNNKYFEQLIDYFPTPRYQLRSDQIKFLFKNFSSLDIIKKVNELIVDEIYDNLSLTNKKEPEAVLRQRISKICAMNKETFHTLCDDFSVPKYYKKEGKVQFLLNNYPYNQIIENDSSDKVETNVKDVNLQKVNYMP